MDDIRRQDRRAWVREIFAPGRLLLSLAILGGSFPLARFGAIDWSTYIVIFGAVVGLHVWTAYNASIPKRWQNKRFSSLWGMCEGRLQTFDKAIKLSRKHQVAGFEELPQTIKSVGQSVYAALRRSDWVYTEIVKSEGWLAHAPKRVNTAIPSHDEQAQELYRIADKNIAEYQQHYRGVVAGIQRTEAQAAVFTTTVDTLRVKLLGYRLTSRQTGLDSKELLEALTEAKMQLDSIDKALEELELTPFPKTVAVMPDSPLASLEELHQSLHQGDHS